MKHIRLRTRLISGLCVLLAGTFSVILRPDPSRWTGRPPLATEKAVSPPAVQQLSAADTNFSLTFQTRYNRCGHEHVLKQTLSSPPDPVRLEIHYSDWEFVHQNGGYVLMRSVPQLCPKHILARRKNGHIILYQNKDGGEGLTSIAMLDDPLKDIHSRETIDELDEGIIFDDWEALERYIESLNS